MSVITVASSLTSIAENAVSNVTFTFTRTAPFTTPLANPLTVNYAISGTANPENDYTESNSGERSVTFAANSATATLIIDPTVDTIPELSETVIVSVAAGANYTLGSPSSASTLISNTGGGVPTVSLTALVAGTTSDSPAPLVYRFTRTGNTSSPLTVFYDLDGAAQNGVDYRVTANYVTIPAGSTFVDLPIYPIADSPNAFVNNFLEINIISSPYATDTHEPLEGLINPPDFSRLMIDPTGSVKLYADKNTVNADLFVTVTNVDIPVFLLPGLPLGYRLFADLKPIAAATIGGVNKILMKDTVYGSVDAWTMTSTWVLDSSVGSTPAFPDTPESAALLAQFGVVTYPDPSDATGFPACPDAPVGPPIE